MNHTKTSLVAALVTLGALSPVLAANLKDKVNVEIESVKFHADMDPGMYMCAAQHLHIRAALENRADVPLGRIKVAGKVFDGGGALMGTATASTGQPLLVPGEKAGVDLEFLTVIGSLIEDVERHEIEVVEAPAK
jgi:hypothetical protein